mgnify:CR=1 FL=1
MAQRLLLYTRFERFWHWAQAALVFALAATGFEVHGSWSLVGFEKAALWHNTLAWALVVLVVFAVFWHFTTGTWMQYLPTRHHIKEMLRYYLVGIFENEPHPTKKTELSKLNPLQRVTYFGLKILVFPVQIISGFAYYFRDDLAAAGIAAPIGPIAFTHTLAAFLLLLFIIAHVYLTTTGRTASSNIRAMITGWEETGEDGQSGGPRTGESGQES